MKTKNINKSKKDLILEKRKNTSLLITAAVIIIAATGAYIFFTQSPETAKIPQVAASDISFTQNDETITYPAQLFEDRRAHFFTYNHNNIAVKYFILKSSDNVIRAAFDACDVCWRAGKGYEQDGNVMICRNCGRRFESTMINEVQGGCNPAPLERAINDNAVTIKISDIKNGANYFDFQGSI